MSRTSSTRRAAVVMLSTLRLGWGVTLFARPARLLQLLGGGPASEQTVRVARLLAGRQVAEAILTAARPTVRVLQVDAIADGLHASTALGYARLSRHGRRLGHADAAVAGAFSLASAALARTTTR